MNKSVSFICMMIGSTLASLIPSLWGAGMFSIWGMIFSALGAMIGIWCAFTITR